MIVNNLNPAITAANGPVGPTAKGSSITATLTYSDTGTQDTHTCTFTWDDGTTDTVTGSSGTCTKSHTYALAGVYTVGVEVKDDDTGVATGTLPALVVIYDPGAGFVTGGGFVNVVAGSCKLTDVCGTATGKANFGFVSQYKKGASVPTGQTEFQFQAGNLNFHSEAYQSLVVSGWKAQYRGTGKINGVAGYSFTVTAYDGQATGGDKIDRFRIKIWKTSEPSEVVFDNRWGSSDDMDVANPQELAGGSIVIHK
ncbi:MAG TPA: PKD domain-containing protein [Candidatus Limnocylindrales bacterium]|nr:PKD domain-containing protein [Candidatus Limnocylindrales bacterium]